MLDVLGGQANIPASDVPAWDSPENPEHIDYVAVEHQMAVARLPIPAVPVTVITADQGQSNAEDQQVWLAGKLHLVQDLVVASSHNVLVETPDAVLTAIENLLALRAG